MTNDAQTGTVVLVEGDSDRAALLALERRIGRGLSVDGIEIISMRGATNALRYATKLGPSGLDVRLLGLCDEAEVSFFERAFTAAGMLAAEGVSYFVCRRDLEEELIRAMGVEAMLGFLAAREELSGFRSLQRQPAQRGRPIEEQLHRFIGTRSGRKIRYGGQLVEVLPLDRVPRPLVQLIQAL